MSADPPIFSGLVQLTQAFLGKKLRVEQNSVFEELSLFSKTQGFRNFKVPLHKSCAIFERKIRELFEKIRVIFETFRVIFEKFRAIFETVRVRIRKTRGPT